MKTIRETLVLFFLATVFLVIGIGDVKSQTDWPSSMGPTGDGVWHEQNTINKFPTDGPVINWRKKIGAGYSGAAISNGRLFVADRIKDDGKGKAVENAIRKAGEIAGWEQVLCLDVETGEQLWAHKYDCPYKIAYPTGPRCTPTVDGEMVYTLGAMGKLVCLNVNDGKIIWEKELTAEYKTSAPAWGYSSPPLIDGNSLYVAAGGEGSGIVALEKSTGKELWRSVTTFDIAYAPLVLFEKGGERQLIFWHAESIDSLDPETGEIFWSVNFPERRNQSQTSIAMPRLVGDQLLIAEYYKGCLLLDIGSNPPSVTERWRSQKTDPRNRLTLNTLMTTPVCKDGYAYCIANDSRGNGVFRCIEIETGKMVWTKTDWMTPKPKVFATAFVVENQDKYFMFSDIGELMIVKLSPDGFEELDRAKVLEPTGVARGRKVVWCQPACANGRMFIRNDEEIICIDLRRVVTALAK